MASHRGLDCWHRRQRRYFLEHLQKTLIMPKITWKKWRVGLLVTILLGLLSGCAGLATGMSCQAFIAVVSTSLVTHIVAYLSKSPIEEIEE